MRSARSRRRIPVRAAPVSIAHADTPEAVGRAVDALALATDRAAGGTMGAASSVLEVDLIVGTNRLSHGLGRRPLGVVVTPKEAAESFAWGYDWHQPDNPHPERQAWIVVVGAPMTARLVFF